MNCDTEEVCPPKCSAKGTPLTQSFAPLIGTAVLPLSLYSWVLELCSLHPSHLPKGGRFLLVVCAWKPSFCLESALGTDSPLERNGDARDITHVASIASSNPEATWAQALIVHHSHTSQSHGIWFPWL